MNKAAAYSLSVLSGLLLAACFAPLNAGWLAWVAAAPLFFAVARAASVKEAFLLGGAAGLAFYVPALIWMPAVVHYTALLFWAVFALWPALHAALLRALLDRAEKAGLTEARALLWAAAAGLLWAGIEYFRSEVWFLECPWLVLGYSQATVLPLFQSLSLWGVYGLSAFLAAANAAWALLPRRRWLPAAAALAALAALWNYGDGRLKELSRPEGRPLKAALVQAERADIDSLLRLSAQGAAAGADLLVWPECSVMFPSLDAWNYVGALSRGLGPLGAEAVVGVCVQPDPARGVRRANFTLHFGRGGRPLGLYNKMHPVQIVEAGLPANPAPWPVSTPLGRLAPQICYDLAFEDGARAMAEAGAELLVVPTLDPLEWTLLQHGQHSDMTSARSVETGLWTVRAASSGRSQVTDPSGRETASLAPGPAPGVLLAEARLRNGGTFYTAFGWVLAPLAFLFALAAAALLLIDNI